MIQEIYTNDYLAGMLNTVRLYKQGANVFDIGSQGALFPTQNSQTKWRYAKTPQGLRLHDGNNTYNFTMPSEIGEEDTPIKRLPDTPSNEFENEASEVGLAQVHRSDPGSIYFTLQEGRQNPTYTIRHEGGENWRLVPKKRIRKVINSILGPIANVADPVQILDPQSTLNTAIRTIANP
jgi:hypothetical protein